MHRPGAGTGGALRQFPRARGDAPFAYLLTGALLSVPPRARGCTVLPTEHGKNCASSPARAGMHLVQRPPAGVLAGFPRARGDAPRVVGHRERVDQVPPRARGCTPPTQSHDILPVGSPARAGMHPFWKRG